MSISFTKKIFLLISILCLSMLFTANLWGVLETSEARYAEISREMNQSGDWLHPTLLGIHHYHKPPVTYWLTAASFSLFGVNDFAVRFFLTLAFGLQVYLVFLIAKSIFENEESAWFSSLVYASLPIILIAVRGLTTDAFLTTFILLSIYFLIQLLKTGNPRHLYYMAFFLGVGFLTKGPVIFILPAFVAISFWNWFPNKPIAAYHYFFGLLFFVLIGVSWFAVVIYQEPKLADYFFFRHFVDRIANAEVFVRSKPWYYYLPLVPLISIPWIWIFISGFFNLRKYYSPKDYNLIIRITIGWFLLPLLFFSISSSKLVLYIIPIFTGFSLVTGSFITSRSFRNFSSVIILIGIIYSVLAIGPFVVPNITMAWWMALIPLVCLGMTIWFWVNRETSTLVYDIIPILFALNLIVYGSIFLRNNNTMVNGMTEVANFINEKALADREILVYDELLPSLSFELRRELISIHAGQHTLKREVQFENTDKWRSTLIDVTDSVEQKRFNEYLSKKIVLIKKSKVTFNPDSKATTGSWKSQVFGKWTVYYN